MYWYVGGLAIGLVLIVALVAVGVRRVRQGTGQQTGAHPRASANSPGGRKARRRR